MVEDVFRDFYFAKNTCATIQGVYQMINYELRHHDCILVLCPDGPLEAEDFASITHQVDNYLEGHGQLHGVLIHAKSFPGWADFGALLAHIRFLKGHLKNIEKVAVVANGAIANIIPNVANHFIHAQVQHFDFDRENAAWEWLSPSRPATQANSMLETSDAVG